MLGLRKAQIRGLPEETHICHPTLSTNASEQNKGYVIMGQRGPSFNVSTPSKFDIIILIDLLSPYK